VLPDYDAAHVLVLYLASVPSDATGTTPPGHGTSPGHLAETHALMRSVVEVTPHKRGEHQCIASNAPTSRTHRIDQGMGQGQRPGYCAAGSPNKKAAVAAECLMVTVVVIIRLSDFVGMLSLPPRDCQSLHLLVTREMPPESTNYIISLACPDQKRCMEASRSKDAG